MLDTKVLAAVLVSLAAASIAFNGGSGSLETNIGLNEIGDMEVSPTALGAFTGLAQQPEPDTQVSADLNFNGSAPVELELNSATLKPSNLTSIEAGERSISSGSAISLYDFEGTVTIDEEVEIEGTADGMTSSGVNISESFDLEETVETEKLNISDTRRTSFELESVEGSISSESTSTTVSGDQLSATSFSGSMNFNIEESGMKMDGMAASVSSGSFILD